LAQQSRNILLFNAVLFLFVLSLALVQSEAERESSIAAPPVYFLFQIKWRKAHFLTAKG